MIVWLAATAAAWDSVGATWSEMPVPYWISEDLGPVDDAATVAAITAAFDTWAAVDCADIAFAFQGRSDSAFGVVDGKNTIALIPSGWPEDPALVTLPALTYDGATMVEADLAVNTEDHVWVLDGADGRTRLDLQAGMTHEIGHLLGLWHSTVADATLNPLLAGDPEGRTLADDDVEGICTLYPFTADGAGALGDACTASSDCADPNVCVADGAEQYCAPSCPDGTCPASYTCLEVGGDEGVCAKATGCGCRTVGPGGAELLLIAALGVVTRRSGRRSRRRRSLRGAPRCLRTPRRR